MAIKKFQRRRQDVADESIRPGAYAHAPDPLWGPRGAEVEDSDELQRINALPRRKPIEPESLEAQIVIDRQTAKYRRDRGQAHCRCKQLNPKGDCIKILLPVQAIALREISIAQGVWGSIVVGGGKSFLDLLAILALDNCRLGLLLVPPNLMRQICRQWEILAEHNRVPTLVAHVSGEVMPRKYVSATDPHVVLHVMSHNGLSTARQSDFIEQIKPDVIVIDEADAFADLTSSRTIRLNRYMREHGLRTKCVILTGSPMDKAIEEMAHLLSYALKERSPLPNKTTIVEQWGRAVNAVDNPIPAGALMQLVGPEDEGDTETELVRAALSRRMYETAGVIMTSSADVENIDTGAQIRIEVIERAPAVIHDRVLEALEMVRAGERPDRMFGNEFNEIFDDPKEQVRCAREVACGMFYRWVFPRREHRDVIKRWYEVRRAWNSELREKILKGEKFLDSKLLCEMAARRYHGDAEPDPIKPEWRAVHWPEWHRVKDTVKPETAVCRIDDFLVRDAIAWGREYEGVIWYSNVDLARWINELSGLQVYGGGPDGEERIEKLIASPQRVGTVVCSMNAHGRGRDGLQLRYSDQLILNVPSSSKRNQQLYARLHRRGQKSEVVRSWYYAHTVELQSAHLQAIQRSEFVETMLRQRQKLRMGLVK